MRRINYLFFLSLLLFIAGCNKSVLDNDYMPSTIIKVGLTEKIQTEKLSWSRYLDSALFVELDTSAVVGQIEDCRYVKDAIYIRTKTEIFSYDTLGNLLLNFKRQGRGRGEYLTITAFDINESNGEISIYDNSVNKVFVYDDKGMYVRSFELKNGQLARDMAVMTNKSYLFYTPDYMEHTSRGVWQTDSVGEGFKQLVSIDPKFKYHMLCLERVFYHLNGDTVALLGGVDHNFLYHISCDTVCVPLQLQVDIKIPKRIIRKYNGISSDEDLKSGKMYVTGPAFESERLFITDVSNFQKRVTLIYDKSNGACIQVRDEDDYDMSDTIFCPFSCCDNGVFLGWLDPNSVVSNEFLKNKFPNVTLNSNPIISIVKPKM